MITGWLVIISTGLPHLLWQDLKCSNHLLLILSSSTDCSFSFSISKTVFPVKHPLHHPLPSFMLCDGGPSCHQLCYYWSPYCVVPQLTICMQTCWWYSHTGCQCIIIRGTDLYSQRLCRWKLLEAECLEVSNHSLQEYLTKANGENLAGGRRKRSLCGLWSNVPWLPSLHLHCIVKRYMDGFVYLPSLLDPSLVVYFLACHPYSSFIFNDFSISESR